MCIRDRAYLVPRISAPGFLIPSYLVSLYSYLVSLYLVSPIPISYTLRSKRVRCYRARTRVRVRGMDEFTKKPGWDVYLTLLTLLTYLNSLKNRPKAYKTSKKSTFSYPKPSWVLLGAPGVLLGCSWLLLAPQISIFRHPSISNSMHAPKSIDFNTF